MNNFKTKLENIFTAVGNISAGIHNSLARKSWYGEHGDLKILAAVVALVIFFNIHGRESLATTRDLVLPVRVEITQPGTTVLDFYTSDANGYGYDDSGKSFHITSPGDFFDLKHKLPKTVRVTFKGSPAAIRHLANSPAPYIAVEVEKFTKNRKTSHMMVVKIPHNGVRGIGSAKGLNVVSIDPPYVRLAWDEEVSRRVPAYRIHTPTTGEPSQGAIPEIEILTEEILLTGSRRMFERMEEAGWVVSAEKIDVSRRAVNFIESVRIDIPADIGITDVSPQYINVRVKFKTAENTTSSISGPNIPVAPDDDDDDEPPADDDDDFDDWLIPEDNEWN